MNCIAQSGQEKSTLHVALEMTATL